MAAKLTVWPMYALGLACIALTFVLVAIVPISGSLSGDEVLTMCPLVIGLTAIASATEARKAARARAAEAPTPPARAARRPRPQAPAEPPRLNQDPFRDPPGAPPIIVTSPPVPPAPPIVPGDPADAPTHLT